MADGPYRRCKHTHECLLNEDFYLPDVDLDRGLDLAKQILVRQDNEDDVDLLHLLHLYILPIIRLHAEDKKHVTRALTNQKLVLGELDAKIDEMSRQRTAIKENMRSWREEICQELQTEKAIIACNTSFLKLLCQHLEADIRNSYVELDNCQKKVEEAKLNVNRKEGEHYISQLTNARSARDEMANRITKSLYVVEEVGLMIRVSKAPDKQKLTHMHEGYIKIQEVWEGHTKELRELQRKKICATSVREALVSTESDLAKGGQSVGIEISSDGITRPTDVFGETSLPEGWETLQSQVLKSLELNQAIKFLHSEFSGWMHRYCASELDSKQSNSSNWRDKLPTCVPLYVEESINVPCLKISPDHFSRVRQSIREKKPATHYQGLSMTLKSEVFSHFYEVVEHLVKDAAVPSTCFSRLWMCYERCFFSTRSRDILRLYKRAYAESTKKLERILPTVTIRDLELDDEWILNILGLYAPNFVLLPEVEDRGAEIGQLAEELNKELGMQPGEVEEDEAKHEGSVAKPRERLESGISIQGVEGVIRRRKASSKRDANQRNSNRCTTIIDYMWVTEHSPMLSERSSTWSGLECEARRSRGESTSDNPLSASVPNFNSEPVISAGQSDPIPIPQNTNSNARTLPSPIVDSVGDSGVCLNIPKDSDFPAGKERDVFEPSRVEHSAADPNDPLGKRCQDNPNTRVFLERFQSAYHSFRVVLQDTVPMAKLQWLYRCLQEVNTTAEKQSQLIFCGKPRMLSGDDLLTSLILFLLHGDAKEVASGYYHIMLLQDYLPEFLDKGYFGFTVIQFMLAYSFLLNYDEKETVPSTE